MTDHKRARDEEPAVRRTHRKTEGRVLFADVMAQTREMERLSYERARQHAPLRKGETAESPARAKHKRAEERRSARQKLRRDLSPRSPDGGPRALRGGVALPKLEPPRKRRFARDEDAIQDASLHSTAWRNLRAAQAPPNLLPDRAELRAPFALELDAPLDAFDAELKDKCKVSPDFLKPKQLTLASGTVSEEKEKLLMDERVRQVIEEATPLVKKCHAERANVIIANTRQQIAAYIEQRPIMRAKATITALPLQISKLEKVAARRLLRDHEWAPEGVDRPHYSVGRTESHATDIYPQVVTYLSKIAPIPRSTTCMLARGTHRLEDDPIIRFVPYFSTTKNKTPQFSNTELCKDTLVGMDDEVNEFVLRYVVNSLGGDQDVFEAVQRCGAFTQPYANYSEILQRVTREQAYKKYVHELELLQNSENVSMDKRRAVTSLLEECFAIRAGSHLRGRLQPLPAHVVVNHLQDAGNTGMRSSSSQQFRDLAIIYQDFFCRRCFSYSCRNHGREQPVPVVRVDPSYPVVKAASKLWRRVEEEQIAEAQAQDSDMETDEQTPESDEPVSELTPSADKTEQQDTPQISSQGQSEISVGGESMRRSLRAQTAASTKASAQLNPPRPFVKKLIRSKTTDVSEYLGFDGVYQSLTQDKKMGFLSDDSRCGSQCFKRTYDGSINGHTNGFNTLMKNQWDGSEIALLNKLEKSVGRNPCVLATLVATRTCADIAKFLDHRESQAQGGLHKLGLIRSGVFGRNRERNNGVLGNSFEHLRRTRAQRMKDRGANHEYVPCNHDGGSCDSAQCSCMRRDHYCEKSCGCSPDCSNRFPGCHCEVGQCRTIACPCYFASRECNPDVCISCGACELPVIMADEASKGKTVAQLKICGNVNIMRGQMRKIGVASSTTHGWGAYALEDVKKGEFIYEYTGSLLSQDEAERRGNVYDKTTISFLFDLTEDSVVDATRKGNKSKFANHDSKEPKCFARIMLVNGDHRIGIYAKEDITKGDELFFDYGYSGVIPDWSQARIGSGKNAPSIEEEEGELNESKPNESKSHSVEVKEE